MRILSLLLLIFSFGLPLWGAKKNVESPSPDSPRDFLGESRGSAPSWIRGSFTLGSDLTFWSLDDSFSSNLIEMETTRSVPLFYKFRLEIDDLWGMRARLDFFLDQILNPLGLFNPDLSLGLSGTSGGTSSQWDIPLPFWTLLSALSGDDFGDEPLNLQISYKYRVFRWENRIVSKWLDSKVDYFDEKGVRRLYSPGQSFSTGSQWHDVVAGLTIPEIEDLGMGLFLGMEWWSLLAPTLLSLSERDGYSASAEVLMQTWNRYLGFRFNYVVGFDGQDMVKLKEDEAGIGGNLGMTLGSFSGSNDYFQGPGSLGFTLFAGLHGGMALEPWEGADAYFVVGVEGTFSLLNTFGSAEAPGKILKSLPYHAIGSEYALPAGMDVDVSISRWENYGGPYLKMGLKF